MSRTKLSSIPRNRLPTDDQLVSLMARIMVERTAFGGGVNDDDLAAEGFARADIHRLKARAATHAGELAQAA